MNIYIYEYIYIYIYMNIYIYIYIYEYIYICEYIYMNIYIYMILICFLYDTDLKLIFRIMLKLYKRHKRLIWRMPALFKT